MENGVTPILIEPNQPNFVITPYVEDIINRALTYIGAGFPIHFMSPAGTGKTTLAMYVAAQIGRPVILIHGDEELGTRDLVGAEHGYRTKKVVDNFIHSVLKTEEKVAGTWVDNRLTVACKYGFTLIYDEFTRSRPEANNILLSILEEKILDLPTARGDEQGYLRVHPDFSAIFTSNPEEYAGVHRAQDALRDRMITIKLSHYDRGTEIAITCAKSGLPRSEAERIVNIVRGFREAGGDGSTPTIRACIMIAKVLKLCEAHPTAADESFVQACLDILDAHSNSVSIGQVKQKEVEETVMNLIKKYC
ncbi:MAG: gas vesicle protein GvpN [Actinomycetota bacterium]|nr:gas vesicle protein GvpN [Actinomycetota bacterium]